MSKRWIRVAASLYPRSWREEFGAEFVALIEDAKPGWRTFANVLGGAIKMQITTEARWLKAVAAIALTGAIVGGGLSLVYPPNYVSTAVLSVTPQVDPVRATSPEALRQRAVERLTEMQTQLLSRTELSVTMNAPWLNLYASELQRRPLDDVIQQMRNCIRIETRPATGEGLTPFVFSVSFSYPDPVKAQATVQELAGKLTTENGVINKINDDAYRGLWRAISAMDPSKAMSAPPPEGAIVQVLSAASVPTTIGPSRLLFPVWGFATGLILGMLIVSAIRWPRAARQLGGFAFAGCVLACAISFVIPSRYTSTAAMQISPAQVTEDPWAPLPPATSAAEFLRQIKPQILSFERLSSLIQDHRLNLYSQERADKKMGEVVGRMLGDLRIEPVLLPGAMGSPVAFDISFTYSDRYKAQQTVQALMSVIDEQHQDDLRAMAVGKSAVYQMIQARKAGEVLDVLDPANLPMHPDGVGRLVIAVVGLGVGLLMGVIVLFRRRPDAGAQVRSFVEDSIPPDDSDSSWEHRSARVALFRRVVGLVAEG